MKIQLHELMTRLKPDTMVRIEKNHIILIEDEVANIDDLIDDLLGYHHNLVEDLHLNLINTLVIVIE